MIIADGELTLPASVIRRLVNHAPFGDITEGNAADRTLVQVCDPALRIADRIDVVIHAAGPPDETTRQAAFRSIAGSSAAS